MRKSAYLLATWGGGQVLDMKASARHRTYENAEKYYQDCKTLLFIAESNPEYDCFYDRTDRLILYRTKAILDLMPVWKPVHFKDLSMAVALNAPNAVKSTLFQLAEDYLIQIGALTASERKVLKISKMMLSTASPASTIDQEIDQALADLGEPRRQAILTLFARKFINVRRDLTVSDVIDQASESQPSESILDVQIQRNVPIALTARGGKFDAPSRSLLRAGLNGQEKLEVFLKIHKEIENMPTGEVMVEKCRIFYLTTVKPIVGCFTLHCSSDMTQFASKWDPFRHAKFGSKCCKGKDGNCGSA
jgi:hypothetical protein